MLFDERRRKFAAVRLAYRSMYYYIILSIYCIAFTWVAFFLCCRLRITTGIALGARGGGSCFVSVCRGVVGIAAACGQAEFFQMVWHDWQWSFETLMCPSEYSCPQRNLPITRRVKFAAQASWQEVMPRTASGRS